MWSSMCRSLAWVSLSLQNCVRWVQVTHGDEHWYDLEVVNCSFRSQSQSCFARETHALRLSLNTSNGWIFFVIKVWQSEEWNSLLCTLADTRMPLLNHLSLSISSAKTCFRLDCLQRWPLSLPAGDCFCQSEDLYRTRAKVRNRLPGDCHRPIPQQCGRVCFCQATNQWVKSEWLECQQIHLPKR